MNIQKSYSDLINQHNNAIVGYASAIWYEESLPSPDLDLIHDLKNLYATEKMRLLNAWETIKAKGVDFLREVFAIVQHVFEEIVSDVIAFLKKHNLSEIVELLKEIF